MITTLAVQNAHLVQDTLSHTVNVVVHVSFGTVALFVGLIPLLSPKGGKVHRSAGFVFLACLAVVIATAANGLACFAFNAFLSVITLLAAYEGYSGYRAIRIRDIGPQLRDALASAIALLTPIAFVVYLESVRLPWDRVVIYSTLGALFVVAAYDSMRFAFPRHWFRTTWQYEHLAKMIGAYSAIASAFTGTVLGAWQPYSQILPSAAGTLATLGFSIAIATQNRRKHVVQAA